MDTETLWSKKPVTGSAGSATSVVARGATASTVNAPFLTIGTETSTGTIISSGADAYSTGAQGFVTSSGIAVAVSPGSPKIDPL